MDLSIIVVNYNVKFFLHELIQSISRSKVSFSYEIIIVDNASEDGSVDFLKGQHYFPQLTVISNSKNVGFSAANNQGIEIAKGEYVLLLNPDTMVQEDTLELAVGYLKMHTEVGALGVKMVDGSGSYLPESKRGFPSPWASFCKILGLSDLFPRSRIFNQYYLGDLRDDEIQDIEVLTGAFFLTRQKVLDQVGYLDDDYFMYGEDIDLSYRIRKEGFDIVYYPLTTIIHYKGESTNKDSGTYIRRFYGAMKIFADKHFEESTSALLAGILGVTIFLRITILNIRKIFSMVAWPTGDLILFGFSLLGLTRVWARYFHQNVDYYADAPLEMHLVTYTLIWVGLLFLNGAYDKANAWRRVWKANLGAWIIIVLIYAGLSEFHRFSRVLVLVGVPMAGAMLWMVRYFVVRMIRSGTDQEDRRTAIVGSRGEEERLQSVLASYRGAAKLVGRIDPVEHPEDASLGQIDSLDQIVRFHRITELIFCLKDVGASQVMQWMTRLGPRILYRMAPAETLSIIGSASSDVPGLQHTIALSYTIAEPHQRRNKRLLDICLSLILLFISPLLLLIGNRPYGLYGNIFQVMLGSKTWVGYSGNDTRKYPPLRPAVHLVGQEGLHLESDAFYYARDYSLWKDLVCIFTNLKRLDNI